MKRLEMQYTDLLHVLYAEAQDIPAFSRSVTLQVTENCNLCCSYCYQTHKGVHTMSKKTAKKIVDMLFDMYERDDSPFINKSTKVIVLDFIGGEPLLNIETIDYACDYFWHKAIDLRHPWADTWRASIISNGVNYFDDKVQRFLQKFDGRLSFGITIDGDQTLHDACRKHADGSGSFCEACKAEQHYSHNFQQAQHSKATIAPENLPYLERTIRYFADAGYKHINANTIYECEWTVEHAQMYYKKLKEIADFLLDRNGDISVSLFNENLFCPLPAEDNKNYCGGNGQMLAFDVNGYAYPCIRFMESSLAGDQMPLMIGDCVNGLYSTQEQKDIADTLNNITRRSQSTDECFNCPIAAGCAWCTAWNYQKFGMPDKRDTGSCIMHKARSLANVYYWNRLYRQRNEPQRFVMHLPEWDALEIVTSHEYARLSCLAKQEE